MGRNRFSKPQYAGMAAALLLTSLSSIAQAQGTPVNLRNSFPIGNGQGVLCQVQDRSLENKAKQSIFDRSWAVVCRDSARPVGFVYSSRDRQEELLARVSNIRQESVSCTNGTAAQHSSGFTKTSCRLEKEPVDYSIYQEQRGDVAFVAEGLSAYDDATLLALQSILTDEIVDGKIDVASTSIEDPFAFARVQASTLKPEQALAEGYRRNLSGNFAEAAAFFETLQQRTSGMTGENVNPAEYLINRALQKSNLGEFAEADALFRQAERLNSDNPITQRLQRNFEGMHLLNQGYYDEAVNRIKRPVQTAAIERQALVEGLDITTPIASRINGSSKTSTLLGFKDDLKLSERERSEIIDAQALQLIGTVQRLSGDDQAANESLVTAYNRAIAVRDGRVTSITRLRAQILSDLALLSEKQSDFPKAEQLLRDALELVGLQYPETRAVNGAKARLASFLLRRGKNTQARPLYREVVESSLGKRGAISGLTNQLAPYFKLIANDSGAGEEFFKATQILVRPGVAETQAILSRELSAGTGEAARLFRQSVDLDRSIERLRMRFSALSKIDQTSTVRRQREDLASEIDVLERNQQLTQVSLSAFPQYRAVSGTSISLADLLDNMKPDEAYVRMAVVGRNIFMFYAEQGYSQSYQIDLSDDELDQQVDSLRESISLFENGQYVTYPFDIEASRSLYLSLFEPVATRLTAKRHLIFEPDGAMLRLPINLLVTDDQSVTSYLARTEQADGDPFNYVGVKWLGSNTEISTAVSARAFTEARKAPDSKATRQYLGMGKNAPLGGDIEASSVRSGTAANENNCQWAASEWNKPISDAELIQARSILGQGTSEVLTGAQFTDQNILNKSDIADYRILHFATHGLVTAPKPSCPAKPALLTSFAEKESDGLLAFDEIFDLKLDADIVILSACDTAGRASIAATREAGVSSGGGTALDGLVRSFIGAGSRSVLASHWPAPDDFKATERLIGGLFSKGQNLSVAAALKTSQQELMNDPQTSHPYYWSGFAIIGDGARPFLKTMQTATQDVDSGNTPTGSSLQK